MQALASEIPKSLQPLQEGALDAAAQVLAAP
jgi:hypothetical protein